MNEYNHHRIIRKFIHDNKLPSNIYDIFIKASNFTDSINAEWKYFFYHFYYDIKIDNDFIELDRVDEDTNASSASMGRSDTLLMNTWLSEKDFFSTINERPRSKQLDPFDIGNQSDNVAFLHAMGSVVCKADGIVIREKDGIVIREKPSRSEEVFVEHLKKCFAEYLFLENEDKALFMLGIAMHGMMDSFTPSHMNFQHYTNQDMALHAQGDVIPIKCFEIDGITIYNTDEPVRFIPGQFDKDKIGSKLLDKYKKGFNDNNQINAIEYEMLKIFLDISKLEKGGICVNQAELLASLKNKKLDEINMILSNYKYGNDAYIYGESAIQAMTSVYDFLSAERRNLPIDYKKYKEEKEKILNDAIKKWENVYEREELKKLRDAHLSHDFYSKKKGQDIKFQEFASQHIGSKIIK